MRTTIRPARLDRLRRRRRHPGDRVRHGEHVAVRHDRCQPGRGERGGQRSPHPAACRHRRPRSPRTSPAPTAAPSSAGSSASAPAGSPQQFAAEQAVRRRLQRLARGEGQGLHLARDLQQQRRRQPAGDADRRRQRAGHHRSGRRRGPEHLPRPAARPRAAHRRRPASTSASIDPALVDFFKLGEGGATIGVPFATYPSFSVLQQGPVRGSQAAATRRPRSATCTKASPGTWTPSATSP